MDDRHELQIDRRLSKYRQVDGNCRETLNAWSDDEYTCLWYASLSSLQCPEDWLQAHWQTQVLAGILAELFRLYLFQQVLHIVLHGYHIMKAWTSGLSWQIESIEESLQYQYSSSQVVLVIHYLQMSINSQETESNSNSSINPRNATPNHHGIKQGIVGNHKWKTGQPKTQVHTKQYFRSRVI